jgi:hypothetical protein
MLDKRLPGTNAPLEIDMDTVAPISLMRPDYVLGAKRVSFSHWVTAPQLAKDMGVEATADREYPAFKEDPDGAAIVVTKAVKSIATKEWFRAMTDTRAWKAFEN